MNENELRELIQEYCNRIYEADNMKDIQYYEKQIEELEKEIEKIYSH